MKQHRNKGLALCLVLALCLALLAGCQGETTPAADEPTQDTTQTTPAADAVDYTDEANWAYYGEGEGKAVDLFLICPTVDMGEAGNCNMSLEDTETKAAFLGALNMERGIYDETATLYAPYYRQITFPVYSMEAEEQEAYLDLAYQDVSDAFTYYMEEVNDGQPLILAGFSQGSQLLLKLLEDYFDQPAYQDQLVAAYCIGWPVTAEDLEAYPHLKMAQGEDDTGVIVSFNSEAEGITESLVVPADTQTLGINPLNWKTDSTPADKSLNLGACFTNYDGEIETEIPQLTGAYLDPDRGTLRVTDVDPADYPGSLFPDGVYHLYDYQFFYRNLQENVAVRAEAYLAAQ